MLKKVLVFALAAMICLSAFSILAFADEETSAGSTPAVTVATSENLEPTPVESETKTIVTDGEGADGALPGLGEEVDTGETELLLAATAPAGAPESAAEETTVEETTAAASSSNDDDDTNLVLLIVVMLLLVICGVSITILARKKRR